MRIFLAADGSAGLKVYRLIKKHGHQIVGLAVPDTEANKALIGMADRDGVFRHVGEIVTTTASVNWLKHKKTDLILSIHTSFIMHPEFLEAGKIGYNLHPGPLPQYAGRNPVSWAIFNGEKFHAATLHVMEEGIDTGPIVSETRVPIEPDDTGLTLMARTSAAGVALVDDFLAKLGNEPIETTPQPLLHRRYYWGKQKPDCFSPEDTERYARARDFGPFPSPWPASIGAAS